MFLVKANFAFDNCLSFQTFKPAYILPFTNSFKNLILKDKKYEILYFNLLTQTT